MPCICELIQGPVQVVAQILIGVRYCLPVGHNVVFKVEKIVIV